MLKVTDVIYRFRSTIIYDAGSKYHSLKTF
jgi:hypothetical protein